jgi:hypothetical protein
MTVTTSLPRPASRHEQSLIRFPDRRTAWVVLMRATCAEPLDPAVVEARLAALAEAVPLAGARLRGETWYPGRPPTPTVTDIDPVRDARLHAAFALGDEAPLRVLLGPGGLLGLAVHHAAFDGLAMVAILDHLGGGPLPSAVASPPVAEGTSDGLRPYLERLARPADRVAPSAAPPRADACAARTVALSGKEVTGRLAAACAAACGRHTRARGGRWRKVGITIAVGGPPGVGNVAGFRRIDLGATDAVRPAVVAALATPEEPAVQVRSPRTMRLLQPVVNRFSDSLLVSNLGRQRVAGIERIDFFPVARGRSAVVFGAAAVEGGATTLSIRARDLSQPDVEAILDDAVGRVERTR